MPSAFMIYGAYGFVGQEAAREAASKGLRPILAGRDAAKLESLAAELGLETRVFDLLDPLRVEQALEDVAVVLHCAGPYRHTSTPVTNACLRTGTHYLDLTGEIPVYTALAARDAQAKARRVMLLPGVGFDVVPTDCLAVHLKQRLPSASRLALAFRGEGPAGQAPGTQRSVIEAIPAGLFVRKAGQVVPSGRPFSTRLVDFGKGPLPAVQMTWGDVFTAYYSTGIPNIEAYMVLAKKLARWLRLVYPLRGLFRLAFLQDLAKRGVKPGSTPETRRLTSMHVWGEVVDDAGHRAVARLHGPEAGVVWTIRAALAVVRKVLAGDAPAGFQTPARAYGPDLVLECEGVTREDVE